MINNAKWIWAETPVQKNQYADFIFDVNILNNDSPAVFQICAESEYAVWLNGEFIGCGQYDDYPDNRHFDTYTFKMKMGKNRLFITAYHQGETSMQYYPGNRGICFALSVENKVILSNEDILSAISQTYISGDNFKITEQLGYGYEYSAVNECGCKMRGDIPERFKKSVLGKAPDKLEPRPVQKLRIKERCKSKIVD